jgi:sortase (surface protein transpeptidase)
VGGTGARVGAEWVGVTLLVMAGIAGSTAPAQSVGAVTLATAGPSPADDVPQFHSVRSYQSVALPVRLRIPAVGINSSLLRLGLAADGTIAAPGQWQLAGWYDQGPRPGQEGPAVIVGHVDSRSGPAVFYRLTELRPGTPVYVDRADGSSVRFRVTGHLEVPKSQFPADLMYAPTLQTLLRLVTCGGSFDSSTGHYRDNIVVSAVPG